MKGLTFSCILLAINVTLVFAQDTQMDPKGLYVRLSYVPSIIVYQNPNFTLEKSIPYGVGLDISLEISRKISANFGLAFRMAGKINSGLMNQPDFPTSGYVGPVRSEHHPYNIDIPLHLNIGLLVTESFNFDLALGPLLTVHHFKDHWNPAMDGIEYYFEGNRIGSGLDIVF